MARISTLDDALLAGVLQARGWCETADDNGGHERLAEAFVAAIVHEHVAQLNNPSEKVANWARASCVVLSRQRPVDLGFD